MVCVGCLALSRRFLHTHTHTLTHPPVHTPVTSTAQSLKGDTMILILQVRPQPLQGPPLVLAAPRPPSVLAWPSLCGQSPCPPVLDTDRVQGGRWLCTCSTLLPPQPWGLEAPCAPPSSPGLSPAAPLPFSPPCSASRGPRRSSSESSVEPQGAAWGLSCCWWTWPGEDQTLPGRPFYSALCTCSRRCCFPPWGPGSPGRW